MNIWEENRTCKNHHKSQTFTVKNGLRTEGRMADISKSKLVNVPTSTGETIRLPAWDILDKQVWIVYIDFEIGPRY